MKHGLNPCSNGMGIELSIFIIWRKKKSLNPCSNGMGIELSSSKIFEEIRIVLILVLMEWGLSKVWEYLNDADYGLNPCSNGMGIEPP